MSLVSPLLWQATPYRHPEGELDFYGQHDFWHQALARKVGGDIPDYRLDRLWELGDIHQRLHEKDARALLIAPPSDFSLYDLRQREGWVLFMQIHSLEHERLRIAAGI